MHQLKSSWAGSEFFRWEIKSHVKALKHYPLGYWPWKELAEIHSEHFVNPYPVILVHGVVHNRSAFFPLRRQMEKWKFNNVFSVNYSTWHGSLTGMVEDLAFRTEEILESTGAKQVDIVAHSLGGLVSRHYMTMGIGRGKVRQLISLATPHKGTNGSFLLRPFVSGSLYRDLRRQSYFIQNLNQTDLPRGSRLISVYSPKDWVVQPKESCQVNGVPKKAYQNVEISVTGHLGFLYHPQVYKIVRKSLCDQAF